MSEWDKKRSDEEALEKSPWLAGNRFTAIPMGERMRCPQDNRHPRRRLSQKGQTCRRCGALMVPVNARSGGASP